MLYKKVIMLQKLNTFIAVKRANQNMGTHYHKELEKAIGDSESVLDVGCGSHSPVQHIKGAFRSVGVDAFLPSIEQSKADRIHDEYYKIDALEIGKKFEAGSFDCVIALDLIEHLTKEDGIKLLDAMERITKKKVIVFTPNSFLPQPAVDGNPFQEHKSGWSAKEMRSKGYRVIGINGWKPLRGENADIKLKPKRFWQFISEITQKFVRNKPEKAFQILCVKEK